MKSFLYRFPKASEYGRMIPKSRFFEHSFSNSRLKKLFTHEVERIQWSYKLSPETVNLPAADGVYEIQIISIIQRETELNTDILRAVDRTIPSKIIFINEFENKIRYSAAYKRKSEADKSRQVISDYIHTDWIEPGKIEAKDLPVALNLLGLYERLLFSIIPVEQKEGESLAELIERYDMIQKIGKEITAREKKMLGQKQFNRKVEINSELKQLQGKLEELL